MAGPSGDFIRLRTYSGRTLFYSDTTGPFWSIGLNSFMKTGSNEPLAKLIGKSDYKTVYEDQLRLVTEHGFNTLGAWSNVDELKERMPFGVMLFTDDEIPGDPLVNAEGKGVPLGDSDDPCPIKDPYSAGYRETLDQYIKEKVSKYKNSKMVLCYWIGNEFGLGDTKTIDFSEYLHSKGVSAKLKEWLIKKYKTLKALNKAWSPDFQSFEEAAHSTPDSQIEQMKKDLREFATIVIHDWFDLVVRTIKKYDPNHLISSPKLSVYDHEPFLTRPLEMGHFQSFRGHFDLLSVDMYSNREQYLQKSLDGVEQVSKLLDLPVLVAEFGTRQYIEGWTNEPGANVFVKSQAERAEKYRSQTMQLFGESWIVGAQWFKWADHHTPEHQMNKGIVKAEGDEIEIYTELMETMREVHHWIKEQVKKLTD